MGNNHSNLTTTHVPSGQTTDTALQFLQSLPLSNLTINNHKETLTNALELIIEQFSADNGYILLKDSDPETLADAHKNAQAESTTTFSNALLEKVIQTKKEIIVKDAMNNKDFPGDPNFQRFNINYAICVPIKGPDVPIGALYLDSSNQQCSWNEQDITLLDFVARYLKLAIDVIQLQQQTAKNQRLITAGQVSLKISHSIKNIIQLVLGATEVIDFGLRTNEIHRVKRSWAILKPNLERVRKFMLDMLDFSRERHLELGPCQFNAVIQSAIESLKSQLKQKKTKLHIRTDQSIPVIELDSERIHETATNIILNAIDIVDENTGVVTVETKYLKEQGVVQFSVTDNGPGISDEAKERIFLPFESTKNKLGTGLGLAIAKQIIEQHKAKIEIDSERGKGATFSVILPAKIIAQEQTPKPES